MQYTLYPPSPTAANLKMTVCLDHVIQSLMVLAIQHSTGCSLVETNLMPHRTVFPLQQPLPPRYKFSIESGMNLLTHSTHEPLDGVLILNHFGKYHHLVQNQPFNSSHGSSLTGKVLILHWSLIQLPSLQTCGICKRGSQVTMINMALIYPLPEVKVECNGQLSYYIVITYAQKDKNDALFYHF